MTNLQNGRKTVASAGTAVVLGSSEGVTAVIVTALKGNTGIIAVGGKGVIASESTRTGAALAAGVPVTIACDDVADVWIDATVNGEGVTWLGITEA